MSGISKNSNALGILLFLLFLSRGSGKLPALGQSLRLEHFIRDMHRMVDMMDRIDGLGQLAFRPSSPPGSKSLLDSSGSLFPPRDSFVNPKNLPNYGSLEEESGQYRSEPPLHLGDLDFSGLNSSNINLPDMEQLMKMAGPLLSMFTGARR